MSIRFILNGRFFARHVTGVERLAIELTRAMREILKDTGSADVTVALPPGIVPDQAATLGMPAPVVRTIGSTRGHIWEQLELPRGVGRAWLLSLCNVGPMIRRRQAVVICDAQFVLHPQSYSRLFRWWYRVLLSVLARRAQVVFTISHFSRTALEDHGIVPKGKARVLRLGVDHLNRLAADPEALARHGLVPHSYILAIGSLALHKNLAMLVDAFVEARLSEVTLVVAGGGNARVFQGAGLREAESVRYLGRVSDSELKALYADALAFACPSLSEGFGFTPLEAMTTGCPVVATTGGAVPEVCGDAAIYADPHDPVAWRDALRRIATDATLRAELSRKAKERVGAFAWQDTARQILTEIARQEGDHAFLARLDSSLGLVKT